MWAQANWRFVVLLATAIASFSLYAVDEGAAFFLEGRGAVARLAGGQVEVSAERFPCGKCHGLDGLGSREGGTIMPPITWNRLSKATGERPAYDEYTVVDAVVNGVGVSGQPLSDLMPRYSASPALLDALTDYLRLLDVIQTVGITARSIAIEPPSDEERRKGFKAAVEMFNRQGGAYGRTISIVQQSQALTRADDVLEALDQRLQSTVRKALLSTIREDGWSSVDIPGKSASPALLYELNQSGLDMVPGADAVMLLEETEMQVLHSRSVYTPFAVAGPILRELIAEGVEVNLVGVGEQAVRWAVRNRSSSEAADGYLAGLLLQDALLASGRTLTRAALDRQLDSLDLDSRAFVTRSN